MKFKYLESPSQIGRIMTNPRLKSEIISETCKTRVEEKYIEDKYGVYRSFWTKEIDKGLQCEQESIDYLAKEYGMFGITKNETKFRNELFKGTPDIIFNGVVYDIKTSWSVFTFPMWDDEISNKGYIYQLQAYMHLTGLKKAKLVYVLTNATEEMIQDELYRRCMRKKLIDATPEMEEQVRREMTFDHIQPELRIKMFDVEYSPEIIQLIADRIKLCEEYYNELDKKLITQIKQKSCLK